MTHAKHLVCHTFAPLAALGLALAAAMPARADRPLLTETADVIDRGSCQVEAVAGSARFGGGSGVKTDLWDAAFTCGIGYSTQPFVGYSHARSASSKVEGLVVGGKTTVIAPQGSRPGLGVGYGVFGSKEPGSGWETGGGYADALATMALAKGVLAHANLGVTRDRIAKRNTTVWSLGLEREGNLTLAADLFGDDRSEVTSASVGAGYRFGERFSVNAVYTTDLDKPRLRIFSVGVKLEF
jgi:hypothetical protein